MKPILIAVVITILNIVVCFYTIEYFRIHQEEYVSLGSVGDAVAGLTTPVINLFSIILIYLSFQQQFQANKIQQKALEVEIKRSETIKEIEQITLLLNDVNNLISNISYNGMRGQRAFSIYDPEAKNETFKPPIEDIYQIISMLYFVTEKISDFKFDSKDERVFYERINIIFREDLEKAIDKFTSVIDEGDKSESNIRMVYCKKSIQFQKRRINRFLQLVNEKLVSGLQSSNL